MQDINVSMAPQWFEYGSLFGLPYIFIWA